MQSAAVLAFVVEKYWFESIVCNMRASGDGREPHISFLAWFNSRQPSTERLLGFPCGPGIGTDNR